MTDHRYKVGQSVSLVPGLGMRGGAATVVRLMPAGRDESDPQYRVKGMAETHERVVAESALRPN